MKGNYDGLNWGIILESDRMDWGKVSQTSGRMAGVCSSNMTSSQVKRQILLNIIIYIYIYIYKERNALQSLWCILFTKFLPMCCGQNTVRIKWLEYNKHIEVLYIHVTMHHNRFLLNNQPDAPIIQIYSVIKLYLFRASSLPIIRSSLLYIQHW
jgi:hypothetical protein